LAAGGCHPGAFVSSKDGVNGILDHVPLATRLAWVRDLFERIDVDRREEKAVAIWEGRDRRGC
jgi:hypothetical protein